jgi:predicted nucleic-acid-binding protein
MRAIDTNVLVRLLVRDDSTQLASAERFISKGAWVSTLALAEAIWVLGAVYSLTPAQQADAVQMLLVNQHVVLQSQETVAAALELFRTKPALGFSDCMMVEVARQAGHLPLGTFDRNLSKVIGTQRL